ncbi:MAG: hypothetical protein ACK5A3_08455, partial [Planctomyces sp.]
MRLRGTGAVAGDQSEASGVLRLFAHQWREWYWLSALPVLRLAEASVLALSRSAAALHRASCLPRRVSR